MLWSRWCIPLLKHMMESVTVEWLSGYWQGRHYRSKVLNFHSSFLRHVYAVLLENGIGRRNFLNIVELYCNEVMYNFDVLTFNFINLKKILSSFNVLTVLLRFTAY